MTEGSRLEGLEPIEEILETAIFTGGLRETVPVAICLIAPSGAGKSKLILHYVGTSLKRVDDLTSSGLIDALEDDKKSEFKHLVIGDLNPVLAHKSSVTNLTIGNLLALTSDGLAAIQDGRRKKEVVHGPVGFITGMTLEMFQRWGRRWYETGFARRFIPVHYNYSTSTLMRAQERITRQEIKRLPLPEKAMIMPEKAVNPTLRDREAVKISNLSGDLARNLGGIPARLKLPSMKPTVMHHTILPLDPHLVLQAMAKAHALKEKRAVVNEDDLRFLEKLIDFTDYEHPVRL